MPRRGRSEGSIYRRADGRWVASLDLGWISGRRERKSFYGRTRRAVAEQLALKIAAVKSGRVRSDERQTLGAFLEHWLETVAKPRVRARTWITYEAAVRRHIVPNLGRKPVAHLAPEHVSAWLAQLENDGVSAGRRRYARVVLRTALTTAVKWNRATVNAAALADAPRTVAREITPLTPEQAQALLRAAEAHELAGFVTIGLSCGLRLGETLGLQWRDVNLDAGTLSVGRAVQRFGGSGAIRRPLLVERRRLKLALRLSSKKSDERREILARLGEIRKELRAVRTTLQVVEPKSNRSRRTIALPSTAANALREQRRRQLEARLAAGSKWRDAGFVFATPIGTPLDPANVSKKFKALLTTAGSPAVRIHDLRHTAATLLLLQGVSPRVVMETLGHSQISLTMNTYTHVLPQLQREAASKMDDILRKA